MTTNQLFELSDKCYFCGKPDSYLTFSSKQKEIIACLNCRWKAREELSETSEEKEQKAKLTAELKNKLKELEKEQQK
jgi:hypothetical protein